MANTATEPKITYNGITFNDLTNPDDMFLLTDVPEGIGAPTLTQNSVKRTGAHGATHGNSFYGRRFLILTGKVIAVDQANRYVKEKELLAAFALPRNPKTSTEGFLPITMEDEMGNILNASAKVAVAPRFSKDTGESWYRDFTITLEMEKYFWEGEEKSMGAKESQASTNWYIDPTFQVVENDRTLVLFAEAIFNANNSGDYEAAPFITIYGAVINPRIINDTTGEEFEVTIELLEGETLEIDTENGIITKIDVSAVETDQSANINPSSQWIYLIPGDNAIRLEDSSPEKADYTADLLWKDTYL